MFMTRRQHTTWLLITLLGGVFLGNVDVAIANIAAPSIRADLRASGGELQLIVSGYTLAYAMLLITGARLGDTRGYRRIFLLGLGVFTFASLACGMAPTALILVIARIVQGIGAALMVSQVLTGIQLNFEGAARARALSLYVIVLSASAVIGQALGGVLIAANLFGSGWRPGFLINVPIGVLLMIVTKRVLPADEEHEPRQLDMGGVATLSTALLLVVGPLVLGRDEGWPLWTWACLLASIPAFAIFVAVERGLTARGGYPLINLHLLARPAVSWGLTCAAVTGGTYLAILFVLALYLQQGLGRSPLYSGLALVSWVAAFGVGGPLLQRLPARYKRLAATIGSLILAAGYAGLSVSLFAGATGSVVLITLLGVGGLGLGIAFSGTVGQLTSAVRDRYAADISGLFNTASRVGGVIGVAIFGTAYLGLTSDPGREAAIHGFAVITLALAASALAAAGAAHLASRSAVIAAGADTDAGAQRDVAMASGMYRSAALPMRDLD